MRRIRVFYKVIVGYLLGSLIFTGLSSCKNQADTEYVDRVVEKEKIIEVEKPVTDKTPPSNVTGLSALNRGGAIQLVWTDAADSDTYGYEVSYGEKAFAVILQGRGNCYVSDLVNGTEYTFTVKSVDKTGNKSEGVSVKATPTAGYLSISLSVPSDPAGGTPVLSNTSADVNVSFGTLSSITKAVWKAGQKGIGVKPNELLSDTTATALTVSSNSATFTVTDSGFYDVVARDSDGHTAWEQVEVKTIDKTAPGEISNLVGSKSDNTMTFSWTNPLASNVVYDSSFKDIRVTYDLDGNPSTEQTICETSSNSVQTVTFEMPIISQEVEYLTFRFKTVDILGNVSAGLSWKYYPNGIVVDAADFEECIRSLTNSQKISVTGTLTDTIIFNVGKALRELYADNNSIRIDLDLSLTTGLTGLPGSANRYFARCNALKSVKLPINTKFKRLVNSCFSWCQNLESITIPNNIWQIGQNTFEGCKSLKEIVIPISVCYIGYRAFYESGIEKISFEDCESRWKVSYGMSFNTADALEIGSMSATNNVENATKFKEYFHYTFVNENYTQ